MKPIGSDGMAAIALYDFEHHSLPNINTGILQCLLYRSWGKFTERDRGIGIERTINVYIPDSVLKNNLIKI
ncbi:hypothetical protein IJ00_04975 [Calothrix sp. 336/3]|nr:hypothetical protein IJ00_04975 [Calothrix sp. 336/3]